MDAFAVWGRLTTYFRTHESMRLYTLVGEINDVEIDGGKLIVWCNNDNYLMFCEASTQEAVRRALRADGADFELVVDKRGGYVDMDRELAKVKKLIGDTKLTIKK